MIEIDDFLWLEGTYQKICFSVTVSVIHEHPIVSQHTTLESLRCRPNTRIHCITFNNFWEY